MTNHELPTSEWEHSHAIEAEQVLIDTGEDTRILVEEVHDDGSVTMVVEDDYPHEPEPVILHDTRQTFTEEEINTALADGLLETPDGLSHELATF